MQAIAVKDEVLELQTEKTVYINVSAPECKSFVI
jgi:hypothetical protein